jgi:uncharacterized membrane protein (DUF4010 family)
VLLVVKLVQTYAPGHGVYFVAALAGTTDVDAITLSMAQYARSGDPQVAVHAITLARALRVPVLLAAAAVIATGAGALLLVNPMLD